MKAKESQFRWGEKSNQTKYEKREKRGNRIKQTPLFLFSLLVVSAAKLKLLSSIRRKTDFVLMRV